ncbi:MAG TPA: 50S ribosomal protein L33 [Candidatus Megaira endosymbiont of Nemacystus decipiens]|nr:50S ribosomal protein L33 [Candidatus Megaera endosymbiont of Nemacystus decipiens]
MSKKKNKNLLVRLVSTAGTGYFLVKKRNPKTLTEKLSFRKYDPKARKHVQFKEEKMK